MMDKLNKYSKLLVGMVIGIVLSGVGAYAAIKVNANEIGYNNTTVADQLDSIYQTMFSNNYSTAPKQVGKWIDDKPLYQRTIQLSLPTQSGAQSLTSNVDVSDVEQFINIRITAFSSDGHAYVFPLFHSNSDYQVTPFNYGQLSDSNPTFYVYFSSFGSKLVSDNNYKIVDIYATIQYTLK